VVYCDFLGGYGGDVQSDESFNELYSEDVELSEPSSHVKDAVGVGAGEQVGDVGRGIVFGGVLEDGVFDGDDCVGDFGLVHLTIE
jgi:hypothetical protein